MHGGTCVDELSRLKPDTIRMSMQPICTYFPIQMLSDRAAFQKEADRILPVSNMSNFTHC